MTSWELLRKMSTDEKIALCEGADFWHTVGYEKYGLASVMMCDGPHGLRKQTAENDMLGMNKSVPATCFPTSAASGCSWDPELTAEIGKAIGEEARANGVALVLGPGLNIKRDPLCGRNFEYYSEDPYLSGKLAAGYVRGVQSTGVGSCLKHFAANSQEHKRFSSDSVMDERTLREIYLTGFEIAVRESDPACVMSSYNKLNGTHVGDDRRLLHEILRADWNFHGFVVTDWGAMNDRALSFRAGCDLNMPGGSKYQEREVKKALRAGKIGIQDINNCAGRVIDFVQRAQRVKEQPCDMEKHHELARQAAEQSAVLLKNEGALPVRGSACMIGHMAKNLRYQGVGSSHINPTKLVNPIDCIDWPFAEGSLPDGGTTGALLAEAAALAGTVDTAVVFAGLTDIYESEGFDRQNMRMPEGHVRMIEAVAAANPNTVVVLLCGSAVELPWIDKVKSVLYMGLPGQAGGEAILNLLTGKSNPGGRLAETWPLRYEDAVTSSYYGRYDAEYREGVYVGYRYYDKAKVPVRFKFGHGLSYTSFEYSNLAVHGSTVTVTVKNTGKYAGAEVAQLYITPPSGGVHRPCRELKGFSKLFLKPGESAEAAFELNGRSFAIWQDGWRIQRGFYTVEVGGLCAEIEQEGENIPAPEWQRGSWYETPEGAPTHAGWESMLGRRFETVLPEKGGFTMDSTIQEMMPSSMTMRLLYKVVEAVMSRGFDGRKDYNDPAFKMMMTQASDCALRGVAITGGVPYGVVKLLLKLANK